MANTSTFVYDVEYNICGTGPQNLYRVNIDTTGTDLELASAVADRHMQASAFFFSENSAAVLKFKSRSKALSGTVATTNGSANIVGTDTNFTRDYSVGDSIVVTDGNTLVIQSITSDVLMVATGTASSSVSGKTHKRQKDLNTGLELAANQGLAKGFSQDLLPIVSEKGGSIVMQSDTVITSMTVGLMFPGKLRIGNKN